MITAMQGAKLEAATKLHEARTALASCFSMICWENKEHIQIGAIMQQIDKLFTQIITNEPADK